MRFRERTERGVLAGLAADASAWRAAMPLALAAALDHGHVGRAVEIAGRPAWLKASALRGRASLRYALRRLSALPLPRERELANLEWLRQHQFRAPEPLAAGGLWRAGLPLSQFLVTARIEGARTLEDHLPEAAEEERAELLDELAREVGRLHARGFVHRDLFARNVLVAPRQEAPADPRRLWLLDAWRGGPSRLRRAAACDLGCLMLEGAGLLAVSEQRRFLSSYFIERDRQGRPADPRSTLERAARHRAFLLGRLRRQPERLRGRPPPPEAWDWSSLVPVRGSSV